MAWRIEFIPQAERDLAKLDKQAARRILRFLSECIAASENPRSTGMSLKGDKFQGLWRYRVGDYRIIARIEDEVLRVLVIEVGHRREIYR
jgi:mRNA interferase RelE/StbE